MSQVEKRAAARRLMAKSDNLKNINQAMAAVDFRLRKGLAI